MYLANIKLWNFRKFGSTEAIDLEKPNLDLNFTKGLNVLIGENDSGKTAIVDAIKLVLRTHSFDWIRVVEEDFFKDSDRFRIELMLNDLSESEAKNFTEWLGWEGEGEDAKPYLKLIYDVKKQNSRILPTDVRAGADRDGYQLTAEAREYLKTTYLKPLRDVKSDLIPKKNSRLSQIFQGHEAFKDKDYTHYLIELFKFFNSSVEKYFEAKKIVANGDGEETLEDLEDKKGKALKDEIDKYIKSFYDSSKETEIKVIEGRLKSILEKLELTIKDDYNLGLGTLNRLFMASELLHLNKKDWNGMRLGLVEELEAHLHPQAQMQVIESLQRQQNIQLILTTHSPNLASKVELGNLIICNNSQAFPMGKVYTKLENDDYIFLERFLDVTKANLFFAKGVIFVEGWAEEILLPSFAKILKRQGVIQKDFTEAGVSVVNVGNTAFLRYSKVFLRENEDEIMNIPISIITDVDIREYEKVLQLDEEGHAVKNAKDKVVHEYVIRELAAVAEETQQKLTDLKSNYDKANIKSFIAPHWTLEYSLHKSVSIGEKVKDIVLGVHPQMQPDNFEAELAKKLINKGLKKTEIAYQLAKEFENDLQRNEDEAEIKIIIGDEDEEEQDLAISYLINAIKYVCGD